MDSHALLITILSNGLAVFTVQTCHLDQILLLRDLAGNGRNFVRLARDPRFPIQSFIPISSPWCSCPWRLEHGSAQQLWPGGASSPCLTGKNVLVKTCLRTAP